MIIFPCQITAEKMGFSFEFLVARIIFALGRTFQNLEKNPKIYLPSIPIEINGDASKWVATPFWNVIAEPAVFLLRTFGHWSIRASDRKIN